MIDRSKVVESCVRSLTESGIEKASSTLLLTRKTELNVESGNISLMRTTDDVSLGMMGIRDQKQGSTSINKTDEDSVTDAVKELCNLIDAGEQDPANDIAPMQTPESFSRGPDKPDVDLMYKRVKEFLNHCKSKYPSLILEMVILDHTSKQKWYSNSNGVSFSSFRGAYNFMVMFTSKEGTETSSFNYTGSSMEDLGRELYKCDGVERLLQQSNEQTVTETLEGNFVGDVIVTPECMADFVSTITSYLEDYPLITKTSIFLNSLNTVIADERLSLHSMPLSPELCGGYFVTGDGFKAENCTVIDRGVLKSFLLSLYGSLKTGREKAVNAGSFYVIDPGDTRFEEMVKSVDKGILLCRFSGGNPSSNGDFSGVAKNSYYIENGKIQYPISETMVAGNLKQMFKEIRYISKERNNNGESITPWITFSGITVSGK